MKKENKTPQGGTEQFCRIRAECSRIPGTGKPGTDLKRTDGTFSGTQRYLLILHGF